MSVISSITNQLLIAMPSLNEDPCFSRAVIYVCEQHEQGSVGLIINRPMYDVSLSIVFQQLQIEPIRAEQNQLPLLYGGPVQPERGFVIHKSLGNWRSSLFLQNGVTVTTSNDIIRAIADNPGIKKDPEQEALILSPQDFLVTLGYTGWTEHQLEREVMENVWLVCPFKPEILYEVPFEERWNYAGSLLGVKMNQLSSSAGHA